MGLDIKNRIEMALNIVLTKDVHLLEKNINERTIAHKLATYLQCVFPEYDVDCEYNGNVMEPDGKKHIRPLKDELINLKLLTKKEEEMIDDEIIERLVYPDIIIHKRGIQERNLCIIEIKKSNSTIPSSYECNHLSVTLRMIMVIL